jgi:phosphoribosylaminoimidazole-succinocarboxamide synthase
VKDLLELEIEGATKLSSGKVREIYQAGENYLVVATDRLSAFDCVLPDPIPRKGEVLNRLSAFWFQTFAEVPNHFLTLNPEEFPAPFPRFAEVLAGRSMLVRPARPLPVECVVRGYLAGSAWIEYHNCGTVGGHSMPSGLREAEKLPEPLFTPSTKAAAGHDLPLTWTECVDLLGAAIAERVRELSLHIYRRGSESAADRGIIIADTKFEFGWRQDQLLLIDECLTPDSSRFWPQSDYRPGTNPPSFDKQFVRDYLNGLSWDKNPPAPKLPPDIIEQTSAKYQEAYQRLTGLPLSAP